MNRFLFSSNQRIISEGLKEKVLICENTLSTRRKRLAESLVVFKEGTNFNLRVLEHFK